MTEEIEFEIKKGAPKDSGLWEGTVSRSGHYVFIEMDVELGILYFIF